MHFISPLDIQFTHDNIKDTFSPFRDEVTGKLREPTLLDTVKECLGEEIPSKVEMLDVIWHQDKIYVAGTFNRRLCVWRLISIFFPERSYRLKVRFQHERDKDRLFTHATGQTKLSTKCDGNWIHIRKDRYVGKQQKTDDRWYENWGDDCKFDPGVIWPEAVKLLNGMRAKLGR